MFLPSTKAKCLQFFYHMYGKDVASLRVYLKSEYTSEEIFFIMGAQGDLWVPVGVDISPMTTGYWVSVLI